MTVNQDTTVVYVKLLEGFENINFHLLTTKYQLKTVREKASALKQPGCFEFCCCLMLNLLQIKVLIFNVLFSKPVNHGITLFN